SRGPAFARTADHGAMLARGATGRAWELPSEPVKHLHRPRRRWAWSRVCALLPPSAPVSLLALHISLRGMGRRICPQPRDPAMTAREQIGITQSRQADPVAVATPAQAQAWPAPS